MNTHDKTNLKWWSKKGAEQDLWLQEKNNTWNETILDSSKDNRVSSIRKRQDRNGNGKK